MLREIELEIEVVRDFLKMADKLIYDMNLNKREQDTIAILRFYAMKTVEAYEEAARLHSQDMEIMNLGKEFQMETVIGYGIVGVAVCTMLLIIMS